MKRHFRYVFLLVCLVCLAVSAQAQQEKISHVIIISVDGLRSDAITALGPRWAPALYDMIKTGAYTLNARTDPDRTVTMPNHLCMFTGRGVLGGQGHEYTDNSSDNLSIHKIKGSYVASIFDVAHDHGLTTAFFASKKKFQVFLNSYGTNLDNGQKSKIDIQYITEKDERVYREVMKMFKTGLAQLTLIHFSDTDKAGHRRGWSLKRNSSYLSALAKTDRYIASILKKIRQDPRLAQSTVVIVTSDHGGSELNHQDNTKMEHYRIPLIIWGKGIASGMDLYKMNEGIRQNPLDKQVPYDDKFQPIRNGDVANAAMALLGLPCVPGSTIGNPDSIRVKNSP